MDELLAEEVINGTMTQDEALEECDDPEKLLKLIRVRKSMRYELRAAVYLAKAMNALPQAELYFKRMELMHQAINNYLKEFDEKQKYYSDRINENRESGMSHEDATELINMIKSDTKALLELRKKQFIKEAQFDRIMNKLTEKFDKYQNMSIQNAYAGIFQGLAEIIDYLADNL